MVLVHIKLWTLYLFSLATSDTVINPAAALRDRLTPAGPDPLQASEGLLGSDVKQAQETSSAEINELHMKLYNSPNTAESLRPPIITNPDPPEPPGPTRTAPPLHRWML